jgi:hypothetical protein
MPGIREIRQKFNSSIRRGTGEAYLLLRENPAIDFSKEITAACLKNYAYDGQCEKSRAPYLYELATLNGKAEEIKPAILAAIELRHEDTWTRSQLFQLTRQYAESGDPVAREAIYNNFYKYPTTRNDWVGYVEIIELDGLDGLKFIASKVGRALYEDSDDWHDDNEISYLMRINPEIDAWLELEKAAEYDPFIKIYLDRIREILGNRAVGPKLKVVRKNAVEETLSISRARAAHRKWTKNELKKIAQRLITEKQSTNREKLLSVFRRNKYPFDSEFILRIAQNAKGKEQHIAFDALANLKSPEIRAFAVKGLTNSAEPQKFTIILKSNYKKGDENLLTTIINNTRNEGLIELLLINLIEVYTANRVKDCTAPLEALYNKSNCALHRYDLVKLLIENDVLSTKIKDELPFDCSKNVRELACK